MSPQPRPWTPVGIGAAAASAVVVYSLILTFTLGWATESPLSLAFWQQARGWFDAVMAGLFGWGMGSAVALRRGAERDLEALRPTLEPGTPLPSLEPESRSTLAVAAVLAVVLAVAINFAPSNWPDGFPGMSDPFVLWTTLRTMLVAWALLRVGWIAGRLAVGFSRLGASLRIDDLLDLDALVPLGRSGLRSVAVWVGITAFFALMLIAPFGRVVAAANLVVSIAVGAFVFVAPVRGAHLRLRAARDAELARIRALLRARTSAGGDGDPADVPGGGLAALPLADLLAWEARIERVRTWPFDSSTLLRFALYVAIGLGSWIGAALVERALGAALS